MKISACKAGNHLAYSPVYLITSAMKDLDYTDIGEIVKFDPDPPIVYEGLSKATFGYIRLGLWPSHYALPNRARIEAGLKRGCFRVTFSDGSQMFFAGIADFDLLRQEKNTLDWKMYISSEIFEQEEKPNEILS